MPASRENKPEKLSRVRQLIHRSGNGEKFISWHPEEFGFDSKTYVAVVVVSKDGKTELHPARRSDEAQRIYRVL